MHSHIRFHRMVPLLRIETNATNMRYRNTVDGTMIEIEEFVIQMSKFALFGIVIQMIAKLTIAN